MESLKTKHYGERSNVGNWDGNGSMNVHGPSGVSRSVNLNSSKKRNIQDRCQSVLNGKCVLER
jgi:hypothetical protein